MKQYLKIFVIAILFLGMAIPLSSSLQDGFGDDTSDDGSSQDGFGDDTSDEGSIDDDSDSTDDDGDSSSDETSDEDSNGDAGSSQDGMGDDTSDDGSSQDGFGDDTSDDGSSQDGFGDDTSDEGTSEEESDDSDDTSDDETEDDTDDTDEEQDNGGQGGNGGNGDDDNGDDDNGDDPSPEPDFEVRIDSPSDGDEFNAGDQVEVEYTVENTGDDSGEQDIEFSVDGSVEETETITLDEDETFTDTFTWDTSPLDEDSYNLEVSSDNDSDSITVDLSDDREDAYFHVSIDSPSNNDEFETGDQVEVEYTVENTGERIDIQDIEFSVENNLEETMTQIELDEDETFTDTFAWDTSGVDEDSYSLEVSSDDDSDSVSVTVSDEIDDEDDDSSSGGGGSGGSGGSVVIGDETNLTVSAEPNTLSLGESVNISGNLGREAEEDVEILLEDELVAETSTNSEGEYEEVITPEETGEQQVTVRADGDEATTTITVTSTVTITSLDAPETVESGEDFDVCVETESEAVPEIELFRNGQSVGSVMSDSNCFSNVIFAEEETEFLAVARVEGDEDEASTTVRLEGEQDLDTAEPDTSFTGQFGQSASNLILSLILGLLLVAALLYRQGIRSSDFKTWASNVRLWARNEKEGFLLFLGLTKSAFKRAVFR